MTSYGNGRPNVIPTDERKEGAGPVSPHHHDEILLNSSTCGSSPVSVEDRSQGTYGPENPTSHNGPGSPPKRSARKSPPIEQQHDRKQPPTVASPSPPSRYNPQETAENQVRGDGGGGDNQNMGPSNSLFSKDFFHQGHETGASIAAPPRISNPQQKHPPQPPISRPKRGTTASSSRFADAAGDDISGFDQKMMDPLITPTSQDFVPEVIASVSLICGTAASSLTGLTGLYTPQQQQPPIGPAVTVTSNISMDEDASSSAAATQSVRFQSCNFSRSGNPRSILNERYQKKYSRSFTKRDFCSIRDARDGDHIPTFTSVFVCPETGETFLSGNLLSADLVVERDGMNWYKKKALAEFAAAGRAEDTFRFRCDFEEGGSADDIFGSSDSFCSERPTARCDIHEVSKFLNSEACDSRSREHVRELLNKQREYYE
eukprot:jgi/Psemu1/3177/gm1.3177_g